jgi:hypothetical protein
MNKDQRLESTLFITRFLFTARFWW